MSNRITMQNNIVTAKKFVQIGSDGNVSMKKRLADILSSYEELNNKFSIKEVEDMLLDNSISPDEKLVLKERWQTMSSSYFSLISTLESAGLDDMEGVQELKNAYSNLYANFVIVLSDMNSSSVPPDGFESNISTFNEKFNLVSQQYITLTIKTRAYSLMLETNNYYLAEEETAIITAKLYKGSEEYTGDDESEIFSTLTWSGKGLNDDVTTYMDGRSLKIPYNAFNETFYVSATVNLPLTGL